MKMDRSTECAVRLPCGRSPCELPEWVKDHEARSNAAQLSAQLAVDFIVTHLKRNAAIGRRYHRGNYRNLAQANAALQLTKLAEALLFAEANTAVGGSRPITQSEETAAGHLSSITS